MSECGTTEAEREQGMPSCRLVVSDEAVPFVARGGRIFPSQVIYADPEIKSGDRVRVLDRRNRVLAVASAAFTPEEMQEVRRNLAVSARQQLA